MNYLLLYSSEALYISGVQAFHEALESPAIIVDTG